MKDYFLANDTSKNRIRYNIYQLMNHFEKMHDVMDKLLDFQIQEEIAKDYIEEYFVEMEKLHLELLGELKKQIKFEESHINEAIRRTTNFLTALNIIDLNRDDWIILTTKSLMDKSYYRKIKALVFNP